MSYPMALPPDPMLADPAQMGMPPMMAPTPIVPDLALGPPPPWPGYKPPPRPKLAEVLAAAERERELHEPRIQQGYDMLRRYNNDEAMVGFFIRDAQAIRDGEVEKFRVTSIRDEIDAICTFIAQMDWTPEALYRMSIDKEEAAAKEDACLYLHECAQRQFAAEGGASLKWRKAFDLVVFGLVAEFHAIDVDNGECGLRTRMIDPSTIFPIWEGGRGLGQVYLKYQTTAADFIGNFGNHPKFKEAPVRKSAGGRDYDPNFLGEVVEYWDRHWCMICWQGEAVLVHAHEYARVPFYVTPGCFGQPNGVTTPHLLRYNSGTFWSADRAEDYKRIYQPFLWRRLATVEMQEAIMGRAVTYWRKGGNPPVDIMADVLDFEEDVSRDNREGAVNKFRQDTKVQITPHQPDPAITQLVMTGLMQNLATSMPSNLMAGQAPMSQGSGTALNLLGRAGLEKWTPVILVLEQHETSVYEGDLAYWRDYGDVLGMEGDRGTIYVPRNRPNPRTGESAAHEVTPELLRRTGIRVKVTFSRFNPDQLPMLAQGVIMAKSANLMPDREGIKILGYTTDPDAAMADIKRQQLEEVPAIVMQRALDMLIEEVKQAAYRNDPESLEQKLADLLFVAGQLEIEQFKQEFQVMQTRMQRQQMQQQMLMQQVAPSLPGASGFAGAEPGVEGGNLPGPNGPQMNPEAPFALPMMGGGF